MIQRYYEIGIQIHTGTWTMTLMIPGKTCAENFDGDCVKTLEIECLKNVKKDLECSFPMNVNATNTEYFFLAT